VELCLYSPICLHGVDGDSLALPLYFLLPCPKTLGQTGAPPGVVNPPMFLNVMVGDLAPALPVDYSHSPTVEPADSSRRIREAPDDAWEQWRSLVFRPLGANNRSGNPPPPPSDYEFYKMPAVYWTFLYFG
jgi:hypothetical protein